MELLIIRHAVAVERGTPGIEETERPLTEKGRKRFEQAAAGLARLDDPPNALWTSPLLRARQTAEIVGAAWQKRHGRSAPRLHVEPSLAGGDPEDLLRALAGRKERRIALVGHEPHLSGFLARLLGATDAAAVTFRKGGAALVDVPGEGKPRLLWFLPPRVFRRMVR